MRKIGIILASLAMVLGLGVGNAQAADNVVVGDWCQSACQNLGMGRIDVSVNFDDTNCDPYSTNNCSGANGAKVDYIVAKFDSSAPYNIANVLYDDIAIDVWGDGTSNYTEYASVTWIYQYTDAGKRYYRADPSANYIRRIRVTVASNIPGTATYTFYGLNPYGV
jgi:hypothetical protein